LTSRSGATAPGAGRACTRQSARPSHPGGTGHRDREHHRWRRRLARLRPGPV